jgi:hypothetical protein
MRRNSPLRNYSCSPPGVGAVSAPSVLVFLCELFLVEGLADDSAADCVVVDFSALEDFVEAFLLEVDGLPVVSAGEAPVFVRVALFGEALALGAAEAVAAAVALGEAVADGEVVVWVCALIGAAAKPRMASAAPHK